MTASTTAHSVNGSTMPASASVVAEQPAAPERGQQRRCPATAGGSTSGSSTSVTTSARPRKRRVARRYAAGRAEAEDQRVGDEVRAQRDRERVAHRRVAQQRRARRASGTSVNSATIGIARNASVTPVHERQQRGERSARHSLARRQPEAVAPSARRARPCRSTCLMKACRAARCRPRAAHGADLVAHRRLRPAWAGGSSCVRSSPPARRCSRRSRRRPSRARPWR